MADALTREALDRLRITVGKSPMLLGCTAHPTVGNTVVYEDGNVRLLCRSCGFEAAKIKVALQEEIGARDAAGSKQPSEYDEDQGRR